MTYLSLSRRRFLFQVPALTGITVAASGIGSFAFAQTQPIGAAGGNFDPSREIYNFVEQRDGTVDDRAFAYDVVVQLMNVTGSASWQTLNNEARVQQIQQVGSGRIAVADRPASVAQLSKTVFALAGVGLATFLMTRYTVLIARTLSTASMKFPAALKTVDTVIEAGIGAYGGYEILKDTAAAFNSSGVASVRGAMGSVNGGGTFDLNRQFPGLKLTFDEAVSPVGSTLAAPVKNMLGWVEQNGKNIFRSEADLAAFMEGYIEKIAEAQNASLERLIEAQKKIAIDNAAAAREAALKERDMAALFQSINNVIGLAIDRFAAPTEAHVMKTLIGAGFQYALSGMTPMGWAAVGINVGTAILGRNKSGGFEKAVMKMLRHIIKQLNTIIEGISEIQKGQVEIFLQINNLLRKIELLEINLETEFKEIQSKLDVIYSQGRAQARHQIAATFMGKHLELEDVYRIRIGDPMPRLQEMRNIALQYMSHPSLTAYTPGVLSSGIMIDLVFAGQRRSILPVSLYDSIGILSAFASYDIKQDAGICTTSIDNPVEFHNVTSAIISWMILLDIDIKTRRHFLSQLRGRAVMNQTAINSMSDKSKVEALVENYKVAANRFLRSCMEIAQREVTGSVEQGALGKQIVLNANKMPDLSGVKDPSMKPLDLATFHTNSNDHVLFNLAKELGLISEIKTISSRPFETIRTYDSGKREIFSMDRGVGNPDQYFPGYNKGTEIGRKKNVLLFKSVIINAGMGAALSFEVPYEVSLHIETFDHDYGKCRSYGHDGNLTKCARYHRKVRSATGRMQTPDKWKESVEKAMRDAGYDAKTVFPKLQHLQSPSALISYLIGEWAAGKKAKIFRNMRTQLRAPGYASMDGAGLSLAAISKLNQVVTSKQELIPFELDYVKDSFLREDFLDILESSAYFDNTVGDDKTLYNQILADFASDTEVPYLQLLRPDGTRGQKMDPKRFVDFATIILSKQAHETALRCQARAAAVDNASTEPFVALTLAKLDGVLNHLT